MTPPNPRRPHPLRTPTQLLPALLPGVVVSLLALAPLRAAAQAPARGPLVVDLGFGARALGMGGAFQPGDSDPDAVFVNPALAARAAGFALGIQRFDTESSALALSTARPWFGGGVFGGLRHLDASGSSGPGQHPGGVDALFDNGGAGSSETALTVGYGRDLLGLRAGIATSWLVQRHGRTNAATVSVDAGLSTTLGPGVVHLAARNLGPATRWGERKVDLPTTVAAGWGVGNRPLGPLDVGAAVDVQRRADGEWLVGGGVEAGYWPVRGRTFVARVGARTVPEGDASHLTVGGSFRGDDLVLDYAFQPVTGTSGVHRITLGWR